VALNAEAIAVDPPAAGEKGATIGGRVVNSKGQGQPGLVVELVRADDTRVAPAGRTDDSGFFTQTFDERTTAALQKEGTLFLHVLDATGKEILFSKDKIAIAPGANVQVALTVPVRGVPQAAGDATDSAPSQDSTGAARKARPRRKKTE